MAEEKVEFDSKSHKGKSKCIKSFGEEKIFSA